MGVPTEHTSGPAHRRLIANALNLISQRRSVLMDEVDVSSGSPTSADFTDIPSWVRKITVQFAGVSTNGTSNWLVQLGTGGSPETSGYLGAGAHTGTTTGGTNFTAGFGLGFAGATNVAHGALVLTLEDQANNTWVCEGVVAASSSAHTMSCAGSKSLAGVLDMIRVTTVNGTDTFDAGAVAVRYER